MSVIAKVMTFKKSGKYYTMHEKPLKPEHVLMNGFDLIELIKLDQA